MNKYLILGDILSYKDLNYLRNLFNSKLMTANARKHRNGETIKRRNHQDEINAGSIKRKRNYIVEICNAASAIRTMKDLIEFSVTDYDKNEALKILSIIEFGMYDKYVDRIRKYTRKVRSNES